MHTAHFYQLLQSRFNMRSLTLILIPLLALPLLGQNEEVPAIPAIPQPPAPVEAPIPAKAAAANLGDTLIKESIEQLKLSGDDLADLYRKYTGRRVIVHSAAAAAEFRFVQPASAKDPLTYREAAELLKKAATIESFVFVPAVDGSELDFLTLASAGLKPTTIGVKVYTETDTLPEGDAVISYTMTFSFLKPDEAVRVFQTVVGQYGAFGSIAASGSTLIITENTSLIRKLIDIKKVIDKPSSEVATRFIEVQFADVTELATTLNELLGQQNESTNTAGVQRQPLPTEVAAPQNNIPIANAANAPSASNSVTPVQIIPDARTNRIFAIGRPVDLIFVEGLVRQFDIKTDQRNFLRRKLMFLSVADFLPIAGDALTRAFNGTGSADTAGGGSQTPSSQSTGSGRSNTQNTQNSRSQNSSSLFNGGGSQGSGSFGGSGGGGGGSSGSRGSSLSAPDASTAPESLLIGRTLLVADNITNSVVVQGPPTAVEIIENLLDQVDVKADQVMISTVFGQLSLGKSTTTGIDWLRAYRGNENGGLAGSSITGVPINSVDPGSIINPITGTAIGSFPSQTGLSLYGKIGSSLGAYVKLLSTSSNFTLLSRPSIFVKNNQIGTISSGKRIAIPTNSNSFSAGGVSTNVEYRDVVLKLEVIPLVNSEKEITLQIALVSDSVGKSTEIEGLGNIPEINTRELLTTVTVPNNQTIVLGGLISTNDTESVTGIPLLSDIPGLGRLFSTKTKGIDRDELMIFIQPSIVNSGSTLDYVQADMDSRYDVSDPARKFSDGSVLPPLEEIDEKGSSVNRSTPPATVPVAEQPKEKRSIRPLHRR
jgi:type II secretion system protein D